MTTPLVLYVMKLRIFPIVINLETGQILNTHQVSHIVYLVITYANHFIKRYFPAFLFKIIEAVICDILSYKTKTAKGTNIIRA